MHEIDSGKGKLWALFFIWPFIGVFFIYDCVQHLEDQKISTIIVLILVWLVWFFGLYKFIKLIRGN